MVLRAGLRGIALTLEILRDVVPRFNLRLHRQDFILRDKRRGGSNKMVELECRTTKEGVLTNRCGKPKTPLTLHFERSEAPPKYFCFAEFKLKRSLNVVSAKD